MKLKRITAIKLYTNLKWIGTTVGIRALPVFASTTVDLTSLARATLIR